MNGRLRELSGSVNDYVKAAWLLSEKDLIGFPKLSYSIVKCRFQGSIGPRFYSLFRFTEISEKEWPTYLLDEDLRPILREINPSKLREIVNNKELFFEHCLESNIPTIPILLRFNTLGHSLATGQAQGMPEAEQLPDGLFFKQTFGTWGSNSFLAKRNADRWEFCGKSGTLDDIFSHCSHPAHGNQSQWIAQPLLQVHKELFAISSSNGLSTVRVISFFRDGAVTLYLAMLRITVGSNVTDNFSQGKTGNLVAPVDIASGRLGQSKGSSRRDFPKIQTFETHPDTGNKVEGFQLPYWEELKTVIDRAHTSLPHLRTLAWDVAITETGPVIVEANPTYDVSGMQVAHQRGIKNELLQQIGQNTAL